MSKTTKKKTTTKKPQTGLAKRPTRLAPAAHTLNIKLNDPERMLPAPPSLAEIGDAVGKLSDVASVGNMGLVELKLSDEEERLISQPVSFDDVSIKPTGQAYLSHPVYTKWFNRAFGRFGWSLVQKAQPRKAEMSSGASLVMVPYVLYVHGHPVAYAEGGHMFYPRNTDQTYDDVIESTVASALRRCAKRIGVGLELWDKRWLQKFVDERCVQVEIKNKDNSTKRLWRLADAPRLPYEQRVVKQAERELPNVGSGDDDWREELAQAAPQRRQAPIAGTTDKDGDAITLQQRDRMAKIADKAGRLPAEVTLWLKQVWKVKSSKELQRKDYDQACAMLEAKGPLALPGDGEVE